MDHNHTAANTYDGKNKKIWQEQRDQLNNRNIDACRVSMSGVETNDETPLEKTLAR